MPMIVLDYTEEYERINEHSIESVLEQAKHRQKVVESVGQKLDQIKKIGDRLAQHPGITFAVLLKRKVLQD